MFLKTDEKNAVILIRILELAFIACCEVQSENNARLKTAEKIQRKYDNSG